MEIFNALGRRKASVARVYLKQGEGKITINGKDYMEFFPVTHIQSNITDPFTVTELDVKAYDVKVNVYGGGFKGQSEAIRLGISRAIIKMNAELRAPLKSNSFLTRDARVVERKKYGKPKARKSFQFSKR